MGRGVDGGKGNGGDEGAGVRGENDDEDLVEGMGRSLDGSGVKVTVPFNCA